MTAMAHPTALKVSYSMIIHLESRFILGVDCHHPFNGVEVTDRTTVPAWVMFRSGEPSLGHLLHKSTSISVPAMVYSDEQRFPMESTSPLEQIHTAKSTA